MAGTVLQLIGNLDSSMISARTVPAPSPPGVSHPQTPRSADRLTDYAMTLADRWIQVELFTVGQHGHRLVTPMNSQLDASAFGQRRGLLHRLDQQLIDPNQGVRRAER